ncbi:MAG TPA: hypothetical protein VM096_03520 [Vicinamibacterales bacterium]|nr:hypothetical protein [Vicinamibacterales bacterium]
MESLKKHGDPLEEEIRQDPVRGAEEVGNNQPGSKGDGSVTRAGAGTGDAEEGSDEPLVRSASQKPNANQPSDDATMPPGADPDHVRNTM